jgi:hypothetical protein
MRSQARWVLQGTSSNSASRTNGPLLALSTLGAGRTY